MDQYSLHDEKVLNLVKTITASVCNKFFIGSSDIQDVIQGIYLALLRTNYLLNFDSKKGKIRFYIYGFVRNYVSKYSKREKRRNRVFTSFDKNVPDMDVAIIDLVEGKKKEKITKEDLSFIMRALEQACPASSFVVYDKEGNCSIHNINSVKYEKKKDDVIFKRSASVIFWLLYHGYSQSQITDYLRVSRSWISKKVASIRENEVFKLWAKTIKTFNYAD